MYRPDDIFTFSRRKLIFQLLFSLLQKYFDHELHKIKEKIL